MSYKRFGAVLGPLLFILIHHFFNGEGLSPQGRDILAATVWIGVWWVFEVLPIAVTALLPIVLFPLLDTIPLGDTTASYGHKYVFLYMGGFMLAMAIEKWNLHKRIALQIIKTIGTNMYTIVLGFMVATAFLSMWISNTATTVMVLPMAISIVKQLKDNPDTPEDENKIFSKLLMLAIAYAASIGGIATLIGTPPNLVFAGFVQKTYGVDISFWQWMKFGLPVASLLLVLAWLYLTRVAYPLRRSRFPGGKEEINRLLKELGPLGKEEKMVLFIFVLTAFCWISRSFLLQKIIPNIDDTIIAIGSAILLFIIPANKSGRPLIQWKEAVQIPWGIILLFGGGMAIAKGFQETGLASYLGGQMAFFEGFPLFILLLLVITCVNFLTEVTSNLATTAMMLPVLAPLALTLGINPYLLMVACTSAASCAFMLPVATPPNAVVFGSGYLRIPDMVRTGFLMNLISIAIMSLAVFLLLPLLWDF
ncbi:MAG TPA: anion transporter [Muricauda sp.]|uniref:SLC13/DASS family transporter n=1 Tax=Flagellimonas aurea TaxID=2915619 RepID=A0ABS3G202_9FLAO|nr:SLC13 family permease [Allomuricauda aurea]MAO17588.1 anion transporter [Allomuricauda sp.]MBO0353436.1 SLC13/DASS family transporter [Allomuricauda aurea]HBU77359.1 anion transporter [Allomuricauda sp.]|tara:strand:- start:587 stop:2020 length:1434 start_codon:yes stop_codon:yes gene_type:complete